MIKDGVKETGREGIKDFITRCKKQVSTHKLAILVEIEGLTTDGTSYSI